MSDLLVACFLNMTQTTTVLSSCLAVVGIMASRWAGPVV